MKKKYIVIGIAVAVVAIILLAIHFRYNKPEKKEDSTETTQISTERRETPNTIPTYTQEEAAEQLEIMNDERDDYFESSGYTCYDLNEYEPSEVINETFNDYIEYARDGDDEDMFRKLMTLIIDKYDGYPADYEMTLGEYNDEAHLSEKIITGNGHIISVYLRPYKPYTYNAYIKEIAR